MTPVVPSVINLQPQTVAQTINHNSNNNNNNTTGKNEFIVMS